MQEERCPFIVKNKNLMQCLIHRKDNQFELAARYLQTAASENDEDAIWLLKVTQKFGGFGNFIGFRNDEVVNIQYLGSPELLVEKKSVKACLATFFRGYGLPNKEYLILCCTWNDPFAFLLCKKFQQCINTGFRLAVKYAVEFYENSGDYVNATKYAVQAFDPTMLWTVIQRFLSSIKLRPFQKQRMFYTLGKWINNNFIDVNKETGLYITSLNLYNNTNKKVNLAINTWSMIYKRLNVSKDVYRMILKMIDESRERPDEWNILI